MKLNKNNVIIKKIRQLLMVLSDYRWWPFFIQRRFMKSAIRSFFASLITYIRPSAIILKLPFDIILTHKNLLNKSGISPLGQLLSNEQTMVLRDYFFKLPVFDPYNPHLSSYLPHSNLRNPNSHIAHHYPLDVVRAPFLLELANSPAILDIVTSFLGCKPTLSYLAVWWSYHTDKGAQEAENFHRDVDDWRFLKLFIYLTDVNESAGPHVYVVESSTSNKLRQIRRFEDAEVLAAFGKERVLTITGKAGQAFLEDTFGIHKGNPIQNGNRLIFQAVYSMFPLPYGPKSPVIKSTELPFQKTDSFDLWTNRVYVSK